MGGWIKLHREILSWEWWDDATMVKSWLTILMLCNAEDGKWHGHTVKAGSFVTSLSRLSAALKLTEKQTRTVLSRLKNSGEITVSSNNRFTVVYVNNWADYQETKEPQNGTPEEVENQDIICVFQDEMADKGQTKGTPEGRQRADKGQTKGNKQEGKNISPPLLSKESIPPRGENAPTDKETMQKVKQKAFVPPTVEEVASYCLEHKYRVNAQAFVSHYQSNGWKVGKNPMRDWKAAVRYWESTDKKQSTNNQPAKHPSFDYAPDESGTDESKWFQ